MFDWFVVLGLVVLAVPVTLAWLAVAVLRLRRQVRELGARLDGIAPERAGARARRPPAGAEEGVPDVASSSSLAALLGVDEGTSRRPGDAPANLRPAAASASPPLPEATLEAALAAATEPSPDDPDPRFVPEGPNWAARLSAWLQANWIYAVSALSLALAGLFLVQYGAERGLLTPGARVLAALALGVALLAGAEVVRRRSGDEGPTSTRVLPSTFAAAGIVVLYGAVLAAHGLYGLVGPEAAFAGLLATAAVALVFGWFYGPFLAAGGIAGAGAAPFLVGGSGGTPGLLHAYFGLLALSGLAIDAVRRWGWVSGLTLTVSLGAASLVWAGLGGTGSFVAFLVLVALAAVAVPRLELRPSHPGPSVAAWAWERGRGGPRAGRPAPPTLVAWGGVSGASLLLWLAAAGARDGSEQLLALSALALLGLGLVVWPRRAAGLEDLSLPPTLLGLGAILVTRPPAWADGDVLLRPWSVTLALAPFLLVALAAQARSLMGPRRAAWAAWSAVLPFASAVGLEAFWRPSTALGPWPWALHVIAAAGLMTGLAARYAAHDGQDRRRAAYAALSALCLIALALVVLLSDAALTVAFAALVAVAAALDRRLRLPEMTWFVLLGVAALGWRLVVLPGLPEHLDVTSGGAPWGEVIVAFGSALLGLWAADALLPEERAATRASVESALLAYAGVFACVLAYRTASELTAAREGLTHWSAGLVAVILGLLALMQAHRARLGGPLAGARRALAGLEAAAGAAVLIVGLVSLNPVLARREVVDGPWPLDTLLLGYALPAAALALAARRATWLPRRDLLAWAAGGVATAWAALAVRRFWHDGLHWTEGVTQPELYSYTVALLAAGGLLLYQSLARRSPGLRRLAMGVIGLAIAKVFLVDAAGLTGLLRVFSFLALGLVLAGLAWLNRWAADRSAPPVA